MAPAPVKAVHGVSRRAVLLGLLGSFIIAGGEPFGVLVLRGSPMGADFSTGAAIFLFLPLTLMLNPLVRLLGGPALRRGELAGHPAQTVGRAREAALSHGRASPRDEHRGAG